MAAKAFREQVHEAKQCRDATLVSFSHIINDVKNNERIDVDAVASIIAQVQSCIENDTRLASMMMHYKVLDDQDYLIPHGLNVAWLAMGVATWMGIDASTVQDVGSGALLKDVGILRLPEQLRFSPRAFSDEERSLMEQYPIHSVHLLEHARAFSTTTLMVAYQAHERCDGSGYPRKRHRMFIHPMAHLTAIADVYSAVTCPRPHRKGVSPYEGMTTILEEAKRKHLDTEFVRSFLDCFTLFPIGSYVELSNGSIAQVIRSNGAQHTKPIVAPLDRTGTTSDREIDLHQDSPE